jgi:hypothetical protein
VRGRVFGVDFRSRLQEGLDRVKDRVKTQRRPCHGARCARSCLWRRPFPALGSPDERRVPAFGVDARPRLQVGFNDVKVPMLGSLNEGAMAFA